VKPSDQTGRLANDVPGNHETQTHVFKDQEAFTSSLIILAFGPGFFSLDEVIRRVFLRRRTA
jgi:hypothetical protein